MDGFDQYLYQLPSGQSSDADGAEKLKTAYPSCLWV